MNDNTPIHPLAAPKHKSGSIRFTSHLDNEEHVFSSCVNKLTQDRCTWFDDEPPALEWTVKMVKNTFDKIRKDAIEVHEVIGDF